MYRWAPSFLARASLSVPRAMATVWNPILAANCTARWPSPPTPRIATTAPGSAPLCRSELYVVIPAHISGPASTADNSSGMSASAPAGASMESA